MTTRLRRRSIRPVTTLAAYLAATGVTQAGLARSLGISQAQVSRLVKGDAVPRPRLLEKIVDATGVSPESFTALYLSRHRRGAA